MSDVSSSVPVSVYSADRYAGNCAASFVPIEEK